MTLTCCVNRPLLFGALQKYSLFCFVRKAEKQGLPVVTLATQVDGHRNLLSWFLSGKLNVGLEKMNNPREEMIRVLFRA